MSVLKPFSQSSALSDSSPACITCISSSFLPFLFLFVWTFATLSGAPALAQGDAPELRAQAEHYAFLKEELQAYRAFIEQERAQHQAFLERGYTIGMIVLGALGLFVGFLNWKSRQDVKASLKAAEEKIRQEYEQKLRQMLDSALASANDKIATLEAMIGREQFWERARIRFTGEASALSSFRQTELSFLGGERPNFTIAPLQKDEPLQPYSAVVHYFLPDENGEDALLQDLIKQLGKSIIPLVIYTQGAWLKGETKKALDGYPFATPANNVITLLNNISDALRLRLN